MKKHKNKIILSFLVIVLLAVSFFYSESPNTNKSNSVENAPKTTVSENYKNNEKTKNTQTAKEKTETKNSKIETNTTKKEKTNEEISNNSEIPEKKLPNLAQENEETLPPSNENKEVDLTCTLSVSCATVLNNISKLTKEKHSIIPSDGIIFKEKEVVFYEGESVFNVLLREMKQNKIHFEFVNVPVFKSAYIEGIGNLYEFDCGELSGWMYRVNGEFPNFGCSQYTVKKGDKIEWIYTCDLGKDIGGEYSAKNGNTY